MVRSVTTATGPAYRAQRLTLPSSERTWTVVGGDHRLVEPAEGYLEYLRAQRACHGGVVALEDPDWGSWHFNPPAPALEALITFICEAFHRWGDAAAGRKQLQLFRRFGIAANVRAEVLALPPGHPYLRLPLQFTTALEPRLLSFVDATELARLRTQAEVELREPERWGTTFTLLQSWGRVA
jgi:hypothetical protein